jgi:hypothetical protein
MFYEEDLTKDIRIKYNATSTSSFDHKNNIYIGGSYNKTTDTNNYQNIVIGHRAKSNSYKSILLTV